jgi:hypothetical protein
MTSEINTALGTVTTTPPTTMPQSIQYIFNAPAITSSGSSLVTSGSTVSLSVVVSAGELVLVGLVSQTGGAYFAGIPFLTVADGVNVYTKLGQLNGGGIIGGANDAVDCEVWQTTATTSTTLTIVGTLSTAIIPNGNIGAISGVVVAVSNGTVDGFGIQAGNIAAATTTGSYDLLISFAAQTKITTGSNIPTGYTAIATKNTPLSQAGTNAAYAVATSAGQQIVTWPFSVFGGSNEIFTALVGVSGVTTQATNVASYIGGAAAPVTGVWHFNATLAVTSTPLTVNSVLTLPVGTIASVASTVIAQAYVVPVVAGTTYTVAAGTVTSGIIGVA